VTIGETNLRMGAKKTVNDFDIDIRLEKYCFARTD